MRPAHHPTATLLLALGALATACLRIDLPSTPGPALFALDAAPAPAPAAVPAGAGLVAVPPTQAAPGLEGRGLVYLERAHEVRHFARSAWAEPPARLIAPLLARALERSGFRVVAVGEPDPHLRLETELVALRQEFLSRPSQVRVALRFRLLAPGGRPLVEGTREALEPAPTDDAYGGVVAANRAVSRLLAELATACAEASPGAGAAVPNGRVSSGRPRRRPGGSARRGGAAARPGGAPSGSRPAPA